MSILLKFRGCLPDRKEKGLEACQMKGAKREGRYSKRPSRKATYFGGKSKVAKMAWDRLGDVNNFIEPFCGSAAMLLLRPHSPRIETLNDVDCYIANFWRATQQEPEKVAEYANHPVNEADMHARHRWLVLSEDAMEFRKRMRTDPHYFDAKFAGWWVWGACCWIGSGWCGYDAATVDGDRQERRPHEVSKKKLSQQIPNIGAADGHRNGVHSDYIKAGNRPQLADAYARGRGVHGNDSAGTCVQRRQWLLGWFGRLRDRLRTVRVCCGDWLRVCDSPSVTTRLGTVGIFMDPPYSTEAGRDMNLYGHESGNVAHDVRAYCLERGKDKEFRIALCGYVGEGHEELEQHGWDCVSWKTSGGYGNQSGEVNDNAAKERIWFSPHCVKRDDLFDFVSRQEAAS